jgi:hypothetical protein
MTKSIRLPLFLLLALWAAAAPFDASEWRFRRAITPAAEKGLVAVRLDRTVYRHWRPGGADLRVVRQGETIPYVLQTLRGAGGEKAIAVQVLDRGSADGRLEFTLDTGRRMPHNRVRIATGERNFRQKVRVEASDDRARWFVLRDEVWIFDFSEEGRTLRSDTIEYPVSTRRYLRISIDGWDASRDVTGAHVTFSEPGRTEREELAEPVKTIREDEKCRCTLVELDAGAPGLPQEWIAIETGAPYFQRAVEVERSEDGKAWDYVSSGVIARLPGEESLVLALPETRSRYLRLRIYNRDDKPLPIGRIRTLGVARQVMFEQEASDAYFLLYGNPTAAAPAYDFAEALARRAPQELRLVTMGAEEANPGYRPPPEPAKPWSERNPALLYGVLFLAVTVLGWLSFRLLSAASRPKPQG